MEFSDISMLRRLDLNAFSIILHWQHSLFADYAKYIPSTFTSHQMLLMTKAKLRHRTKASRHASCAPQILLQVISGQMHATPPFYLKKMAGRE